MHIAICDDNTADRKQMERLLSRESDKRIHTTGTLYVDSYGNARSLLDATLTYDAYYIDMCKTEGITGLDMVNALSGKNIHSPIIMCCSDVNYREQNFPDHCSFLDKPIKIPELSESIDHALQFKKQQPNLIELREDEKTYYVEEHEIIYGVEDGFYIDFTLTNGRKIHFYTSVKNFFSQVKDYPAFLVPSKKVILNCRHIAKFGFFHVVMSDGTSFKVRRDCMPYAKDIYAQLHTGK